ncbi:MAG: CRTAC1 family protein, partial [Acidobacteriota bacterium]
GQLDLVATGEDRGAVWLGAGDGGFTAADEALGLATAGASAMVAIDFDIEGDLDLALAGGTSGPGDLYRNNLEGPLQRVGSRSLPRLPGDDASAIAASDLDRDGDLDLLIAHARGLTWVDNLRQGRFVDRSARAGLTPTAALRTAVSADLDNDGLPDLIGGGQGLSAWHNLGGRFEPWSPTGLTADDTLASLHAFDADNDGRLDLAAAGAAGVRVLTQEAASEGPNFTPATVSAGPASATALASADLDLDGDLDLVVAGAEGLHWLENRGGNGNRWIALRLRGLAKGNSKNNAFGIGTLVEVHAGRAYQFREATGDVVHLGIGQQNAADVVRVVWTNGVPQNRIEVEGNQSLVEEQLLKGSCPFLYAWDGEGFAFVSDLLWGAPIGLPVAPGAWAASDHEELVRFDAVPTAEGHYDLRITEELWEAAFFDYARLWVVDFPQDVEVASSLRIVPGKAVPLEAMADTILASRGLRPVARAWDGQDRDVTRAVRQRDEIYADGYRKSAYQGVAEAWTFTFDLGEAPAAPVRLHLDGWIFPADASLNLAVAQRSDLPNLPPRLEVETETGWQTLIPNMGHPAGKTKTMVVDTPPLPAGASKLRLVTSLWLHWDRIAWTTTPVDDAPIVRARLAPQRADLRYRGFSELVRQAPNAPHTFDYATVRQETPWLPFPGHYTRYGDVRRLLETPDDFSVILAPGDEIALSFDATELPPPAPGFRRTLFLESHGWDKDADRNTFEGQQLEPLPFRA